MPGTFSPALFVLGAVLRELSIFIDESGSDGLDAPYYILALVLHEQGNSLDSEIALYERSLRERGLPDIPVHTTPLLYRKKAYEGMDEETRKRLLSSFRVFFRHLPIRHACLTLDTKGFTTPDDVTVGMRRALVEFMFDNMVYLQGFDDIKVYYDDGQRSIARAIHEAADYALSRNAVIFRKASPADYRLGQAADYICTVELAALRYRDKQTTSTDEKFFGSRAQFKKGILKEVRAKRM